MSLLRSEGKCLLTLLILFYVPIISKIYELFFIDIIYVSVCIHQLIEMKMWTVDASMKQFPGILIIFGWKL
jgi:hypothetical protein